MGLGDLEPMDGLINGVGIDLEGVIDFVRESSSVSVDDGVPLDNVPRDPLAESE